MMKEDLRLRSRLPVLIAASVFGLTSVPVSAQANAPAPQEQAQDRGGEEIVVTARKREESLQDVPVSVSAFSAQRIEDRLASDIVDLADFTPGFQIQQSFGRSGDRPVIRGASNILFTDGKVGIFLDGAPYFGDFSSLELANVERVEVIKGPQSAVFGRGTLSGAINVVLKRPTDKLAARLSGTLGSYDRRELSAFVSAPITPLPPRFWER